MFFIRSKIRDLEIEILFLFHLKKNWTTLLFMLPRINWEWVGLEAGLSLAYLFSQ